MTPFVGNYTPEQLEQGRKDIAETSPAKIEQMYRMGKISLPDKLEMLRGYGQMKRELQIRDMSMPGDGGAMGELKNYATGVMTQGQKAWQSAKDLNAGKAAFHTLMTGLEALKAYDIPGNVVERWALEAGIDPSYARAANWAVWLPANFVGLSQALKLPMKAAGKAINLERKALKGVNAKADQYLAWLKDPVGEATKSAMKLDAGEAKKVVDQLDSAIMQSETGKAFKTIADAVAGAEAKSGVQGTRTNVFHGSPHQFEDFDVSKMGTGQGAQSYGRGLYFAENPDVAHSYAKVDPWANVSLQGKPLGGTGSFYNAKIPDEQIERMLDWDKPLAEQSDFVRDALAKLKIGDSEVDGFKEATRTPEGVELLRSVGIPGVKYSDAGSRGAEGGTRNFVVFSADTLQEAKFLGTGQEGMEAAQKIFETPDDFENGAIQQLIKFYEQKSQAFIRKGVSHEQTNAESIGKMSYEEIINRPPTEGLNAAQAGYMTRLNDTLKTGLENAMKDALPFVDDMMEGKRPDLVGLFRAHYIAFAQTNPVVLGATGEIGRGLEFLKTLQPELQGARMWDTMIKGLGSDMLSESSDAAIAKSMLKLSLLEKDARRQFLDTSAKSDSPALWHSLWKSFLFVVPQTHVTNFVGQNQGALTSMMQYTGAAIAGGADAPSAQSAWALWKGFGSAWLHLPRIARQAWERSATPLGKLGLEGSTDAVAKYGPLRAMGFEDELVSAALENAYINAGAIEQGVQKGLTGKALADFANGLKSDPAALKELAEQAAPTVQHAMYHDPLAPINETIANYIRRTPWDLWLPVVKFPVNALKMTRDWTPGLQTLSARFIDDLAAGGAREAEARSRVTLSWMFSNYLWGEAKTGNLTGGGPKDLEKNKAWQAAGNVPYTWRGVPFRWAEPIAGVIGAVADMAYFSNQMDPDDVEDFASGLGVTLARMVKNNWWLRSMEGVTGVVSGIEKAEGARDFFLEAGKVLGAPFVSIATGGPLGGKVREMLDPEVKQINDFSDYFLGKVPGYSKNVPPQLNYSGAVKEIPPVLGHRWLNLVLPGSIRGAGTADPVGAFLHKHALELPDNWKTFGGSDADRPFFEGGQGRISPVLDSNQSHNWKMLSLTDVRRYDGNTWTEKIAALEADPEFAMKTRFQKQTIVSNLYSNYRDKGKKMLGNADPEVAKKLEIAKERTREMRGKLPANFEDDVDAIPEEIETPAPELQSPMEHIPEQAQQPEAVQ